ncbi:MAG: hypothetical protein ACR2OZ_10045 [Verrucomicrobiales bacterium]
MSEGRQLWRIEPAASAVLLKSAGSFELISVIGQTNNWLVFALESEHQELWSSDGTSAGTYKLAELPPGQSWTLIAETDIALYLEARSDELTEVWRTDGSAAGTVRLRTLIGTLGAAATTQNGEKLFFFDELPIRSVLVVSDGTADGTRELRTLPPRSYRLAASLVLWFCVVLGQAKILDRGRMVRQLEGCRGNCALKWRAECIT